MARSPRRLVRGSNAETLAYTGPSGELVVNIDDWHLHLQDGSTAGGHPMATGQDLDDAIATLTAAITNAGVVTGESRMFNANRVPTGWLEEDGQTYAAATYPALFAYLVKSATVTTTIASPGLVNWTGHGLRIHDPIKFTTTGGLPTGITAGATYYILAASFTADSFRIATTPGGTAINFTGTQSGVHTGINAPHGCADNLATFNVPLTSGEFVRAIDNSRGVDANRAFGSAQAANIGAHEHTYLQGSNGGILGNTSGGSANYFYQSTISTATTGGPSGENRPRNVAKLFCIKT